MHIRTAGTDKAPIYIFDFFYNYNFNMEENKKDRESRHGKHKLVDCNVAGCVYKQKRSDNVKDHMKKHHGA